MEERLQKILSHAGYGSRRASEELISQGRVTVNGQPATLGMKADPQKDHIKVDGKPVKAAEETLYIALYKPRGVISASQSPDPRPTVRDLVPVEGHLYPVGRLDVDSEGLILLSNDGDLANRLTHPRYGHEKEYKVLVASQPDDAQMRAWRSGVVLEDGHRTAPAEVRVDAPYGKGAWLRVILKEGRKRQIRETGKTLGLPVVKIIRVRIGTLQLGNLKPGEWRYLSEPEIAGLKGVKKPVGVRMKKTLPRATTARSSPSRPRNPYAEQKPPGTRPESKKSGKPETSRPAPEKRRRR